MPTDIVMPQMGESIFEGTITKWLKKPGDKVQRDEPLFEISTDKVDAEIPAPASGVLQDIKVAEGATVQVNTVVGTISADGEGGGAKPAASAPAKKDAAPAKTAPAVEAKPAASVSQPQSAAPQSSHEEEDHARSSPLVRKIAREHNINLAQVPGTGLGGRITKQDITAFLEQGQPAAAAVPASSVAPAPLAKTSIEYSSPGDDSRRSGSFDPDAQDHRSPHDRVAAYQRPCPLHVRGGHHTYRAVA